MFARRPLRPPSFGVGGTPVRGSTKGVKLFLIQLQFRTNFNPKQQQQSHSKDRDFHMRSKNAIEKVEDEKFVRSTPIS